MPRCLNENSGNRVQSIYAKGDEFSMCSIMQSIYMQIHIKKSLKDHIPEKYNYCLQRVIA